jgi:acyl dehydratase
MLEESGSSKVFTTADQLQFAQLSGDHNPMHMDDVAARRTPAGAPVVHGMHVVIWALDLIAEKQPDSEIDSVSVRFARFVYLDDPVELRLVQRTQRATEYVSHSSVFFPAARKRSLLTLIAGRDGSSTSDK